MKTNLLLVIYLLSLMIAIIYFSMFVSNLFDGIIARQYLLFTGIFTLVAGIIDEIFEGGETYSRRYF